MPKKNIDFSKTIFYKIFYNDDTFTHTYIGYTTNFVQRKYAHKQNSTNVNSVHYNKPLYKFIRNKGGWEKWNIEQICVEKCKHMIDVKKRLSELKKMYEVTNEYLMEDDKHKYKTDDIVINNNIEQEYDINTENNNICDLSYCTQNHHLNNDIVTNVKLETKKNANNNANQNANKIPTFFCDCGRLYKHKSSFSRHMMVCKKVKKDDKWMTNGLHLDDAEKMEKYVCKCGKIYKYRQGLHKHKKTCKYDLTVEKENKYILDKLKHILPEIIGNNNVVNINNNNIINNVVNNNSEQINIYLNENCANAMSIQDFAKQLTFSIEDLLMKKRECLTNVLLKNIQPLSIKERPFHCSNINNKEWHVKDEIDGWEQDNGEKILKKTECEIIKKWTNEFEEKYPNWKQIEQMKDVYLQVTNKATSDLPIKEKIKMLKEIGEEVFVEI